MQTNVNGVVITLTDDQVREVTEVIRKNQSVTDRIKEWKDSAADQGESDDSLPFKDPQTLKQQQTNSFFRLATTADALNAGKKSPSRWLPYFNRMGTDFSFRISFYVSWGSGADAGAAFRLCVFDKPTSDYFGTQFKDEWEIFTRQPNS